MPINLALRNFYKSVFFSQSLSLKAKLLLTIFYSLNWIFSSLLFIVMVSEFWLHIFSVDVSFFGLLGYIFLSPFCSFHILLTLLSQKYNQIQKYVVSSLCYFLINSLKWNAFKCVYYGLWWYKFYRIGI